MGIPGMHGCSGQPREEMRKQSQKFRKRHEIREREREEQERRAEQLRIEQERRREQARMESMKAMGVSEEMVEPEPVKQPSYVPKQS